MATKYRIYFIESERGWGMKVDDTKDFDTEDEARKFVKEYNDQHNPPGPVPDWYYMAMHYGPVVDLFM